MIILIIIIFIIISLYLGISLTLNYEKKGSEIKGCLKILILRKIKIYSKSFPQDKEKDSDNKRDMGNIVELAKPCFGDFKEFLESFIKCIHVRKLKNHLIFGLDSYADTGKYIGYIWGLLTIVNNAHKNAHLSAEPSFNGSVFDVKGENELNINVLKVIPPAVRLISKKEVRTLIRGVRNG